MSQLVHTTKKSKLAPPGEEGYSAFHNKRRGVGGVGGWPKPVGTTASGGGKFWTAGGLSSGGAAILSATLDTVWAQSRHPEGLQRWHFFCKNPLDETQLSRPSKRSNSMIFDDFCQKFQKNDFFDETFGFLDLFGELEGHTRGEKISPRPFCTIPHPQNH